MKTKELFIGRHLSKRSVSQIFRTGLRVRGLDIDPPQKKILNLLLSCIHEKKTFEKNWSGVRNTMN